MVGPAVRTLGLRRRFGSVVAVDSLDLEVARGEVFGLLGPNGAGKTTTIQVLMGHLARTSGEVEVLGLDPQRQARGVRARTGVMMQRNGLDRYLTGRENLRLFARLLGLRGADGRRRVDDLLAWSGLGEAADRLVDGYSGGMERRLDLAVTLLHRPEMVIMDEPTLGLDVTARRQVWDRIAELKRSGVTVLLTTHYLDEAARLCDRVGIIVAGRMAACGVPEDLKRSVTDDLHRLTITFNERPGRELRFPGLSASVVGGGTVELAGCPDRLWAALGSLSAASPGAVQRVEYAEPSLDDVVIRLAGAGAVP
jgi:ABC-2 type transport system ATP-binding protein